MDMKNSLPNSKSSVVAYVIVAWNNKDLLNECIESILKQDYVNKKIILVDNHSSDDTVEYLKTNYKDIILLPQEDNHGFAKGNNIGIKVALEDPDVDFVVLLNTDARLAPKWTSTLVEAALQRPKTATMQSITLDYYDHEIIDSTHIYISQNSQGTQGSWRLALPKDYDVAPMKVFGCNAAAMLITRKFIEAQPFADFFDETMFMYLEDVDVATRALVMGWDNYVIPGVRAYHMGSASSSKNPSFSLYLTFRNNLSLLIKNLPLHILVSVLLSIPKADRASMSHLRRTDRSKAISAIVKGRLASLLYIPIFLIKRHKLKAYRNIDTNYLWNLMRRGF